MKQLSPALTAHLQSGATSLCWCWRLTRRDGTQLGFTDHDNDIVFAGTTFEAAAGFTASDMKDGLGLAASNLSADGALSSAHLSDHDLAAGLYDDAKIEIWRVNWADPSQFVLMRSGSLGQVKRSGISFSAEIRGLAHYLQQPQGRLFQYTCDATLGDARCGINLNAPTYLANTTIVSVQSLRIFTVANLTSYATDWFTRGLAQFTSGINAGSDIEIKRHTLSGTSATIELWQQLADLPAAGDTVTLTAGCDKTFTTCRSRFANAQNFRGFPHMPGNAYVTAVASPGDPANNGAPMFTT